MERPSYNARMEHLLLAAEHLDAAGLTEDAQKVWRQAGSVSMWQAEVQERRKSGLLDPLVILKIEVIEVSRTKLKSSGYNCEHLVPANDVSVENARTPRTCAVLTPSDRSLKLLATLQKDGLAKVLTAPKLGVLSNQAASIQSGGEARVAAFWDDGRTTIELRPYGLAFHVIPVVLDDQAVHVIYRMQLGQINATNAVMVAGEKVPTLRTTSCCGSVRCKFGQTILARGVPQQRLGSSDSNASVSSVKTPSKAAAEETETLVVLTPEIATSVAHCK
jgi:Flp pilus assembly secretin CpaC